MLDSSTVKEHKVSGSPPACHALSCAVCGGDPMTRRYLVLLTWLAAGGSSSPVLAQPVGPEFQVNTYTPGPYDLQEDPRIASAADGAFIVVWGSYPQDGSSWGVYGQQFSSDGTPQGDEFHVNTYTVDIQARPSVSSDPDGNFVVVWESYRQDGDRSGIFGQRYDSNRNPLGSEFQVNTRVASGQYAPAVASDEIGNFVVVWESAHNLSFEDIVGQRYDRDGTP